MQILLKSFVLSFVSDMNQSISTLEGKMVVAQTANQELNIRLESRLEGNQCVAFDSFNCLTDPGDSETMSTRFNSQSSLLM